MPEKAGIFSDEEGAATERDGTEPFDANFLRRTAQHAREAVVCEAAVEGAPHGPADIERIVAEYDATRREQEEIAAAGVVDTEQPASSTVEPARHLPKAVRPDKVGGVEPNLRPEIKDAISKCREGFSSLFFDLEIGRQAGRIAYISILDEVAVFEDDMTAEERVAFLESSGIDPSPKNTPTARFLPLIQALVPEEYRKGKKSLLTQWAELLIGVIEGHDIVPEPGNVAAFLTKKDGRKTGRGLAKAAYESREDAKAEKARKAATKKVGTKAYTNALKLIATAHRDKLSDNEAGDARAAYKALGDLLGISEAPASVQSGVLVPTDASHRPPAKNEVVTARPGPECSDVLQNRLSINRNTTPSQRNRMIESVSRPVLCLPPPSTASDDHVA